MNSFNRNGYALQCSNVIYKYRTSVYTLLKFILYVALLASFCYLFDFLIFGRLK